MKKLILILIIVFGLPLVAISSPFLISDCQDDFQGEYVLIFDTNPLVAIPAVQNDCSEGQVMVKYDMAQLNLSDGQHHLDAYARNVWGSSIHVPFDFTKIVPETLSNTRLTP